MANLLKNSGEDIIGKVDAAKKILVEDINLSFYRLGKKGPGIVLLHGWGASKEKLFPLGKALFEKGWRVLIPDLPGFGESDLPPKPWGVGEYAEFVIKVMGEMGVIRGERKFWAFGHSFGGRVAIKMAALYPEKIAGIVLCGSAGITRPNIFKRLFFLILAKTGKLIFPKTGRFRRLFYKLVGEHDYEKTKGVMRETFKLVIGEDLKPPLAKIKIPTLIFWGTEDKMTKYADARVIHQAIEDSKLISFPGLGHTLPYQKPKELAERITEWKN